MSNGQQCDKCGKDVSQTWGNPKVLPPRKPQQLCFDCLDEVAPEYVNKYPGWRERERVKLQRAEQARKNFNHGDTARPGPSEDYHNRECSASPGRERAGETQKGLF